MKFLPGSIVSYNVDGHARYALFFKQTLNGLAKVFNIRRVDLDFSPPKVELSTPWKKLDMSAVSLKRKDLHLSITHARRHAEQAKFQRNVDEADRVDLSPMNFYIYHKDENKVHFLFPKPAVSSCPEPVVATKKVRRAKSDHVRMGAFLGLKAIHLLRTSKCHANHTIAPSELFKVLSLVHANMNDCPAKTELDHAVPSHFSLDELREVERQMGAPFQRAGVIYVNKCKNFGDKRVIESDFNMKFDNALTVDAANKFVKEKTDGKVEKILSEGDIDRNTVFVILSTSLFVGDWQFPFNKTVKGSFRSSVGEFKDIDFMRRKFKSGTFALVDIDAENQAAVVPYKQVGSSRYVACVVKKVDVTEIDLCKIIDRVKSTGFEASRHDLILSMPKFNSKAETDVKPVLKSIGVHKMFSSMVWGDLNGVYVYKFLQKATCDVCEEKTVCASATVAVGKTRGISLAQPSLHFQCDSTFLFFVLNVETGSIVSMTYVDEPAECVGKQPHHPGWFVACDGLTEIEDEKKLTIGSAQSNDLVIKGEGIEPFHATMEVKGEGLVVTNTGGGLIEFDTARHTKRSSAFLYFLDDFAAENSHLDKHGASKRACKAWKEMTGAQRMPYISKHKSRESGE